MIETTQGIVVANVEVDKQRSLLIGEWIGVDDEDHEEWNNLIEKLNVGC